MRVILAVVGQEVRGLIKNMRHILILLGLILFLLVIGCHWIVSFNSKGKTFDHIAAIPHNQVGLLLATYLTRVSQ